MAAAAVTQAVPESLNVRRSKERTPEPTVVVIFGARDGVEALTKRFSLFKQ